ncbi:hypothetical protein GCM10023116_19300 [Kistimonas scapharcae]|uniref:Uncharacterized protein n=2 Tax=Kistimonas scapharcae TaxID=1036133 RepID=A0ABP8V455_9GAMM
MVHYRQITVRPNGIKAGGQDSEDFFERDNALEREVSSDIWGMEPSLLVEIMERLQQEEDAA